MTLRRLGFLLVLKRLDKRTAQLAVRFRTFSEFAPLVVAIGLVEAYLPLTAYRLPLTAYRLPLTDTAYRLQRPSGVGV